MTSKSNALLYLSKFHITFKGNEVIPYAAGLGSNIQVPPPRSKNVHGYCRNKAICWWGPPFTGSSLL